MPTEYDRFSKAFHWIITLAVVVQYASVLVLPDDAPNPTAAIDFHMSFGVTILALMLLRFGWRLFTTVPPHHEDMPGWQAWASTWMHYLLYALLIVMPLLGWLWASALGWPITIFGLFNLPPLVATSASLAHIIGALHSLVGGAIVTLVGLHVAAALYHWLIVKDGVMQRMWP